MKHRVLAAFMGLSAGLAVVPAAAQGASDLAALKAEMQRMQRNYAAQMRALEKRLEAAEARAAAAQQNADTAQTAAKTAAVAADSAGKTATAAGAKAQAATEMVTASADKFEQVLAQAQSQMAAASAPPPPPPTSNNAFNPGIAAVLNGFYFAARHDPNASQGIVGVMMGDEAGKPQRGFSIGESEVSFTANIDPFLSGFLDVSFDNANQPSVEEAYILTKDLPWGLTVKAGRFLSGIGYINERHSHDWQFSDA